MQALLRRPFLLVFLAILFSLLYKNGATIKNYAVYGLPVGAGVAAKLGCSFHYVGGRSVEQVKNDDLSPFDPLLGLFEIDYNTDNKVVTASAFGLLSRRAQYRSGFGCTAIPAGQDALPPLAVERPRPAIQAFEKALPDAKLQAAVDNELRSADTRAVLVIRNGKLLLEGYAEGFDAQSKLLGWSIAKSVTGTAIGVLLKRGVLSLQQDHLLAEWDKDERANIKLVDLLQMSSGLSFDEHYGPGGDVTNMLFASDNMSEFVAASELMAKPGEKYNYSSGTSVLLMRIAQRALGEKQAFYDFIYRDVLDQIGMVDSIFEPDGSGLFVGGSFLYATPHDYARFGQLYLRLAQGDTVDILPADWYATVSTAASAAPEGKYGAHFWLNQAGTKFDGVPTDALMSLGHNGQVIAVLPSQNTVLIRLGWSTDGVFKPEHFISRMLQAL